MLVCKRVHLCSVDLYDYVAGKKVEGDYKRSNWKVPICLPCTDFLRSGVMFQSIFFEKGTLGNGITCK